MRADQKRSDSKAIMKFRGLAPLAEPDFRRIWSASLMSNLGQLVLGVAAAWEMTRLTNSPVMVAAVQSALMLPQMLVAVPAGAIADMFDRRKIAMSALVFSFLSATLLALLSAAGLAAPWTLLVFCFLVGGGVAMYSPSWQASVPEQVSTEHLPAAAALGSVSYNIARSFGPAMGGVLVMAFGTTIVFGVAAILYLPLLAACYFWNRRHVPPRLPPERLDRAIISGIRYAAHSSPVRTVMLRSVSYGVASGSVTALIPLIAKDVLHGNAGTYGLLLGAGGIGAVVGTLFITDIRERITTDRASALCMVIYAAMIATAAFSPYFPLSFVALLIGGAAHMIHMSLLNVSMQLSVPRWVMARALAWYTSSIAGGIALGAWIWGNVATRLGVSHALAAASVVLALLALLTRALPLRDVGQANLDVAGSRADPEVALALSGRSGPVHVEIDYRVDPAQARAFYDAMLKVQRSRQRNGGFGWMLSRDIGDVALWTEHFAFPTWQDYLRHRERVTEADLALQRAATMLCEDQKFAVRRRLERPFGSVRWKADTPDPSRDMLDFSA